jgi:glutathione S-transferase
MLLCYSALSPFCRKVQMVMDYNRIAHEVFDSCDIAKYPVYNPRAEIPMLVDGTTIVLNSSDILGYLDRRFPDQEVYPRHASAYACVRMWELEADTLVDAVVTDVGIYKWADIPPAPEGILEAARLDLTRLFDRMETELAKQDFIAGALSVADFALYVHISSAQLLQIGTDNVRHPSVMAWLQRMIATDEVKRDTAARMQWWATRDQHGLDTHRINWGTHRLEWFLANGFVDHFVGEVRGDRVLWSVGPNSNAKHSPLAPSTAN